MGLRLIVDIGAVLLTLALLSWLGNTKDTLAKIGKNSLAVYILHGFVVRGLQPVLDDSRNVLHDAVVLLICVALAVAWTGLLAWSPFERALRWWSSTVTGFLLKPFPFLRPEDSDRRGGRGRRGDVDAHAAYPGVTHHPGNAYSEGDGPDRQGLGLQPLPGVGYQHSPGSEQQPGQQQSFASPAPATGDPFPLPGSHEVPQNNATYEPTQEVPAGAAQRAVRYRRLPVYLSGDDH